MSEVVLDRAGIAARIPHQGSMCLLDAVIDWDGSGIRCRANSHLDPDNPMRMDGRLGAACGIEYAAQAMAVHGALNAGQDTAPRKGYVTRVQQVTLHCDRLDDCATALTIEADHQMGNDQVVRYEFRVHGNGRILLAGVATVILNAG